MIKSNYEIIKTIVERQSKNKDLSISGKHDGLSLFRYVYYKICKDYLKKGYSHTDASKTIKRKHNNSMYALRCFKNYKDQKFFHSYLELYNDCYFELLELESRINLIVA